MDLTLLNEKFRSCNCGKAHECPIDFVKIGSGAINELPLLCGKYQSILLISDTNTYPICGDKIISLLCNEINKSIILEDNGDVVIPNEEKISEIESALIKETDFIIGIGSGVINDLCKHVAFKHKLDYCIIATAPSMDGYASVGSALILKGMKVTLNAKPPKIIIGDTDILKSAPIDMIKAGYGDIIGKYSCLNDWKLSALINNEYFCEEIYKFTLTQADKIKAYAELLLKKDAKAIEALMEALVYVGIAMSYVGNSRPASGSEHHLSHFFEITGILENKPYYPHGIDVIYSSAVTAKIREAIINSNPTQYTFSRNEWEENIKRIYLSSSDEVIALQDKLGWYEENEEDVILKKLNEIKSVLKECPSFTNTVKMISDIGLSYDEFLNFYGNFKIKDAIFYAKDLKDRYSVLWLNYKFFKGSI